MGWSRYISLLQHKVLNLSFPLHSIQKLSVIDPVGNWYLVTQAVKSEVSNYHASLYTIGYRNQNSLTTAALGPLDVNGHLTPFNETFGEILHKPYIERERENGYLLDIDLIPCFFCLEFIRLFFFHFYLRAFIPSEVLLGVKINPKIHRFRFTQTFSAGRDPMRSSAPAPLLWAIQWKMQPTFLNFA